MVDQGAVRLCLRFRHRRGKHDQDSETHHETDQQRQERTETCHERLRC